MNDYDISKALFSDIQLGHGNFNNYFEDKAADDFENNAHNQEIDMLRGSNSLTVSKLFFKPSN